MSRTIVIVGVGALGSNLVQFLRSEDIVIKVIDFDRVESQNLKSQFHVKSTVGRNKTESLKKTMSFLFGTKMTAVPHRLTKDNTDQLLGGADLVVDCLDNGASRELVQAYVREQGIPCVHGGLSGDGEFGRVVWDEEFTIDHETTQGAATCENGEFLPFIAVTAAFLAQSVQLFLREGLKKSFTLTPLGANSH